MIVPSQICQPRANRLLMNRAGDQTPDADKPERRGRSGAVLRRPGLRWPVGPLRSATCGCPGQATAVARGAGARGGGAAGADPARPGGCHRACQAGPCGVSLDWLYSPHQAKLKEKKSKEVGFN